MIDTTTREEELLCDIHNMDLSDHELSLATVEVELRDFSEDELRHLISNLDRIKKAAQRRKAIKSRSAK